MKKEHKEKLESAKKEEPNPSPKPVEIKAKGKDNPESQSEPRFTYDIDPRSIEIGEDNSIPVHYADIPKEIRDKYPNFAFRWVSDRTLRHRGRGYHGWALWSDASLDYGEGLMKGHDLRLAVKPKELAEKYREDVAWKSTQAIHGLQEAAIEQSAGLPAGVEPGLTIGKRPALEQVSPRQRRTGGNYNRGLSREEVHERVIKAREDRAKRRTIIDMGKSK